MGADNVSYIAVFPNPIRQSEINKMRKYLLEVKVFIVAYRLSGSFQHQLEHVNSMSQSQTEELVKDFCFAEGLKFSKATRECIAYAIRDAEDSAEALEYPEELDVDPPYGTGYHDSASRTVRLGGKCWDIVSAGELSWSGEPQGKGFQELKLAFRWGVVRMLGGQ